MAADEAHRLDAQVAPGIELIFHHEAGFSTSHASISTASGWQK
jgi:hypothetical protein